jgi:hypothetical protein
MKACATCGVAFRSYSKTRRFCSMRCRSLRPENVAQCKRIAHGPRPGRAPSLGRRLVCKHCGVEFRWPGKRSYCLGCEEVGRMNKGRPGHKTRRDDNHAEIAAAFLQAGASVVDLAAVGCGVPDLLVSFAGALHLVEVKNPSNSYGRKGLNKRQAEWAARWRGGPVYVARSISDVKRLLCAWRERRPTLQSVVRAEHAARPIEAALGVRDGEEAT